MSYPAKSSYFVVLSKELIVMTNLPVVRTSRLVTTMYVYFLSNVMCTQNEETQHKFLNLICIIVTASRWSIEASYGGDAL